MASFSDLVRAQRQSGRGVITSLTGAYNQKNMERYDPRNVLFSKSGLMTSLFPGLKGYQAAPISGKRPTSLISSESVNSPSALNSIARDARISARNSMALPSIARNMSQMVRIWGGSPAKYFDKSAQKESAYEAKFGGGKKGLPGLGKSAGGGGFNILGMLGGALGGIGSALGSVVGGIGSVAGSILGGIGNLLGGAASGIFGVLSSALGGMGFVGILAAGAIGFVLYQIWKGLDFSKLGGGLSDAFSGIKESLSGIFGSLDDATGGKLGKFVDDVKDAFMKVTIRISAAIETATELLMKLGGAVLKDFSGYFENFFQENKGKIFALMAIGMMGPRALMTLPGAAITAIAAAVGAATGEVDLDTMKRQREEKFKDLENFKKTGQMNIQSDADASDIPSKAEYEKKIKNDIAELDKKIQDKENRTNNTQTALNNFSLENVSNTYDKKFQEKMAASTGASTAPSPAGPLSGANLLDMIGAKEGGKMGYDAANKGKAGDMPQGYPGLSKLTVGQVMDLQAKGELFAVGKYQFIPKTLAGLVAAKIAKREDQFSPVIQDKLAMELVNRRLKAAGSDPIRQQFELSKEFASIENPYTGSSYYAGSAGNKSLINSNQMQAALRGGNLSTGGNTPQQLASSRTPSNEAPKLSAADSAAAFASDQVTALDRMMGGKLMKGSTDLADMMRDITREFMNNPTFVDNSQTVNNNGTPVGLQSAVTGSVTNRDAISLLSERASTGPIYS